MKATFEGQIALYFNTGKWYVQSYNNSPVICRSHKVISMVKSGSKTENWVNSSEEIRTGTVEGNFKGLNSCLTQENGTVQWNNNSSSLAQS